MKPALYYKNEHIGCSKYKSKEDAAFFFESTSEDNCVYKAETCKNNLLVFVVEGSIRLKSHYFRNRKV
ncbi:MAG: hypothetical protein ACRC77_12950, partial [Bacteroidales bacterium]